MASVAAGMQLPEEVSPASTSARREPLRAGGEKGAARGHARRPEARQRGLRKSDAGRTQLRVTGLRDRKGKMWRKGKSTASLSLPLTGTTARALKGKGVCLCSPQTKGQRCQSRQTDVPPRAALG